MLFKIAKRNLLRNKRRSLIVLISIVVGVMALLLNDSFGRGMVNQMLNNQLDSYYAHLQIHQKDYLDNKVVKNHIKEPYKIINKIEKLNFIESYTKRAVSFGLISSATNSSGVSLIGVVPELEKEVTTIDDNIIEGEYLSGKEREVVMGAKLAEKLDVMLGDKLIGVANSYDGDVSSELFRVVGIFKASSSEFEKANVYVPINSAQKLFGIDNGIMEIALKLDDINNIEQKQAAINKILDNESKVSSFKELLPMIMTYIEMYDSTIYVFYAVIIFAILFGIINTMLMSVFERIQEFGVLMSIGMKNGKIFLMVLQEAFILGIVGTVVGFILGYLIYLPLSIYGIDFSVYSESLTSIGLGTVMYPELNIQGILNTLLIMPFAAVLGAIYPAIKAIRLQPTDAMRYI
jgi:ABC-type lipoprotein release transport system permease subunit